MTLDQAPSVLQGLEPAFAARLSAMLAAAGGRVRVVSGARTNAQQQKLYAAAAAAYGPAAANRWVAQPGHSNHETGQAVDLEGDMSVAHQLLPQFGLVAPMAYEPWHVEPFGVQTNPQAYTTPPPGFPDPTSAAGQSSTTAHLAAISQALAHLSPDEQKALQATTAAAPVSGGGPPGLSPEDQAPSTPASTGQPVGAGSTAPPSPMTPVVPTPAPTSPQVGGADNPMAAAGTTGDAQKLMTEQPISGAVTPDQANAAAGQAGVLGNPSGSGHIATTPQRQQFAKALIAALNSAGVAVPDTPENERAFIAWQQGEGTSAAFNPLATTTHMPGSTAFNNNNGDPVQNFTSFDQGVQATVKTLLNGNYAGILSALGSGSSAISVAQAIANSPWGTGRLVLRILEGQ